MKVRALLSLVLALLLGAAAASRAFVVRVDELEVFNSPEIAQAAQGLRSMLASRISGEGYEVSTADPAPADARFRVRTTITRLGSVVSLDVSLEPLQPGAAGLRTYETMPSADTLPRALDTVALRLRERLSGQRAPADPQGALHTPVAPAAPLSSPVPSTAQPYYAASPVAAPALLQKYSVLGKMEGEPSGFAVADADGDGQHEILFLFGKEIVALRETATGTVEAWRKKLTLGFAARAITAADTDGDGTAELYVLGISDYDAITAVFQWSGGELAARGKTLRAYLRPLLHPDQGLILAGTPSIGEVTVFKPRLHRYSWTGKDFELGEEIPMPGGLTPVNVSWARFLPGGDVNLLSVDQENRLRIFGSDGSQLYQGDSLIGGTRVRLEGAMRNLRNEEAGEYWEIDPAPSLIPFADGSVAAVFHDNIEENSFYPRRWGSYDQGKLLAYRWDGLSLQTLGQSPAFPGYFLGTIPAPKPGPNGRARLYAILVKSDGYIVKDYTAHLLAFDL